MCEIGVKQMLCTKLESHVDATQPAAAEPSPRQRSTRTPPLAISVGVAALVVGLMAFAAGLQELTAFRNVKTG